ncbi:ATP-binding protein [Streptomyces sp. NPDC054796]
MASAATMATTESDSGHTALAPREYTRPHIQRLPLAQADVDTARTFTRQCLEGWQFEDPGFASDVTLVVSELVGNAVQHAIAPEELRLIRHPGGVLVEVDDIGPGRPVPLPPSVERGHGRGLAIVDALACRWTVRERGSGRKTVRAVMGYPGAAAV